jgi:tetratricopeptide (TPR) repeat protein
MTPGPLTVLKSLGTRVWKLATPRTAVILVLVGLIGVVAGWLGTELYAESRFQAARRASERYDLAAARDDLATCLWLRPRRFQYHFLAAQTARRMGDFSEAEEHLEECQRLAGPEADVSLLEWSLLRAQRGAVLQVDQTLWLMVKDNHPDKVLILEAMARGYIQVYRLLLADRCLKMLLDEAPGHPDAWLWRGGICELLGNSGEALAFYRRALKLRPDDEAFRLRLATALLRANQVPEAFPHLRRLYREQPDNPEVLIGLARYWIGAGKAGRGRELLARALAVQPANAQALAEQTKLALAENDLVRAWHCVRKALDVDPADRTVLYQYYQCQERRGEKAAAEQTLARLRALEKDLARVEYLVRHELPKKPRDPDLYCEMGRIFSRHGRPDRGLRWFKYALAIDPGHRPSRAALATCSKAKGKYERPLWSN